MTPDVITTTADNVQPIYYRESGDIAAFVGMFEKGPINKPVFIKTANQFKLTFGRATNSNYNDWYQVYNYLQYANGIWVNRSSGDYTFNASSIGPIDVINDDDEFREKESTIVVPSNEYFTFVAQTAGEWGNLLSVAVITKVDWDLNVPLKGNTKARDVFPSFKEDYYGFVIFRKDQVVESFFKTSTNIDQINDESNYIYVKSRLSAYSNAFYDENYMHFNGNFDYFNGNEYLYNGNYDISADGDIFLIDGNYALVDGNSGVQLVRSYYGDNIIKLNGGANSVPSSILFKESHEILKHVDNYDIDIIIGNDIDNALAVDIAETRKDCIAFIGIPAIYLTFLEIFQFGIKKIFHLEDHRELLIKQQFFGFNKSEDVYVEIDKYLDSIPFSQYVHFTMNAKQQLDPFTNKYRAINIAGDIAGLKAKSSYDSPWTVAAGLERGIIKNMYKMLIQVDDRRKKIYYRNGLNFVEDGALMTQKTYTTIPTSFNRVNVRALFNHVEKIVARNLRLHLFKENTVDLRGMITSEVKRFLENVKASRGIDWGRVEVHPDKNDPNAIVVDVYIKPIYVAEYIQLRMKNVGTDTVSNILSSTL